MLRCWALRSSSERDEGGPHPGHLGAPPQEANVGLRIPQLESDNRVAERGSPRAALRRRHVGCDLEDATKNLPQ